MREILFRGKGTHGFAKGKWVYGYYLKDFWGENRKGFGIHLIEGGYSEVDPETVGQYTGLTDKNGKKIFEGDIVRCKYANAPNNEHIQKVVFFEGKFMAEFLNGGCYAELYYGARHFNFDKSVYMTEFEAIGNIHDNPELLKEG